MKIIRKIALTELQSLFFSPIAWLIIIIFSVQSYVGFMDMIGATLRNQETNQVLSNLTVRLFGLRTSLFPAVTGYLYLYLPLLTMGLMSRELNSGSIKLLYSSPVTNLQIILGKFLSMMVCGLVMIAILLVPVGYAAFTVENFDWPVVLTGLLGIYLLICAYSAIGLFMSSLTSYPVVAGLGTLAVLALLNYVGGIGQGINFIRDLTYWFDMGGRTSNFASGLISSEDIFYFLLVVILFLSLSILRMKAIRQKAKGWIVWSKYAAVVLAVFMAGYLSSRPAMKYYHDSTRTKQLTLTENSQDIIGLAEGALSITTYVNILEKNYGSGIPRARNTDTRRFEQYLRFKPEIRMKYVYYYAMPEVHDLDKRFPDLTPEEIVGRICSSEGLDSTMFRPVAELAERETLAREGYSFLRILERGDGQRAYLRMFDDIRRHPSEREISAALKRTVMPLPAVGFVGGHGERSIYGQGDRGYYRFSHQRSFRHALINQGFDVEEIALDLPVPEHINIIVIADMRHALTPQQEANLDTYVARGGNLLIAGEVNRQEAMNPLVGKFGLHFMPGQIVYRRIPPDTTAKPLTEHDIKMAKASGKSLSAIIKMAPQEDYLPDFVTGNVTPAGTELAYGFREMMDGGKVVAMPGCMAIGYSDTGDFETIPLLMSNISDSWNELETTDFIDGEVVMNPALGEKEESLPMGIALTRDVAGKEQKILVLGDSDCISNGEISRGRANIPAANFNMLTSTFYWLSDSEVPIDVRRPATTDTRLLTNTHAFKTSKFWIIGVFPALLLATGIVILLRRRGR